MQTTGKLIARSVGSRLVEAICVPREHVADVWPHVEGMIAQAVNRTGINTIEDARVSVLAGYALLWVAWDGETILGVATTEINETAKGRVCLIGYLSGKNLNEFFHLKDVLIDYAKSEKCAFLRIIGRKGWLRRLRNEGFKMSNIVMERPI